MVYNITIMGEEKNGRGNQPITQEEKDRIVHQIEPYLKSGLSIRKACLEARIPKSTFYKLMDQDEDFRDKIETFKNFVPVLLNSVILRELQAIVEKQNGNEAKGIRPQRLDSTDIGFLKWFATTSNLTKEEWGERKDINLFDPEVEIQKVKRMIEESSTTELPPLEYA